MYRFKQGSNACEESTLEVKERCVSRMLRKQRPRTKSGWQLSTMKSRKSTKAEKPREGAARNR
eukprot:6201655-Pleurochrysis_carterae.AAC.4